MLNPIESHRRPLEVGHSIAGYQIVREIGRGGFGIVYEAHNPVTRDRVAIKQFYPQAIASWVDGTIVVKRDDDKDIVEKILQRFEDEATLQFNFDHPNILEVKNFVRADNTGYLISDYVDGCTLFEFLKPHGNVFPDVDLFRRTMEPIADAIAYVHERLALHRDVSPDNILIDRSGRPILIDFGAAKLDLRRNPGMSSIVPYKEAYAPVEQQVPGAERPEGYYTDIYALAGTMYCTLSGRPPARAIDRVLTRRDPYVQLAVTAKVKCPEVVYSAIDRGLTLAAAGRPQTMAEFMRLLGWRDGLALSVPADDYHAPRLVGAVQASETTMGGDQVGSDKRNRQLSYAVVAMLIAAVICVLFFASAPPLRNAPSTHSAATASSTTSTVISTAEPTYTAQPTKTPASISPTYSSEPTYAPQPAGTPAPTYTSSPTYSSEPTSAARRSDAPLPSSSYEQTTREATAYQAPIEPRAVSPGASSPSFDCSKNLNADEQAVCRSPQLSYKDQQLAALYVNLRRSLSASAAGRLRDEQRAWLKSRSGCGANEHCLLQLYASRIQALQSWR
jgi:serine/threonine protein kinase